MSKQLKRISRRVQILEIMNLLTKIWLRVPELRFGQLVSNIWRNDIEADIFFYRSDENVFGRLDRISKTGDIYEAIAGSADDDLA